MPYGIIFGTKLPGVIPGRGHLLQALKFFFPSICHIRVAVVCMRGGGGTGYGPDNKLLFLSLDDRNKLAQSHL